MKTNRYFITESGKMFPIHPTIRIRSWETQSQRHTKRNRLRDYIRKRFPGEINAFDLFEYINEHRTWT